MIAGFLAFWVRYRPNPRRTQRISRVLAIALIFNECSFIFFLIVFGYWDYHHHLPLNLCDLTMIAVVIALLWYRKWIWEVSYFWALGGTLQAVLTPDLTESFPSYIFFKFFLSHGLILIAVIYLAVGCRRLIEFSSIKKVFLITHVYAVLVGLFNFLFNTNYSYLCAKPSQPSILDYFGPWPYYLLGIEFILIASLYFYYIPFFIVEKMGRNRRKWR